MYLESPPPKPEPEPDRLPLALRATALGIVAAALMGVLLFRLWALQVLHSDQFAQAAAQNQVRHSVIPAARGEILDSQGIPMVINQAGLQVQLNPATLPQPADCHSIRPRHREALKTQPGCAVMYRLAKVLQVKFLSLVRQYQRGQTLNHGYPVTLSAPVTKAEVEYVKERMPSFRGVQFEQSFNRRYPLGVLAPNILGNVGRVSRDDLPGGSQARFFRGEKLDPNGTVGKTGVEMIQDRWLRGTDGQVAQSFDAAGNPVGQPYLVQAPQSGDNVQLNINAHLQRVAQQAIYYGIQVAHSDGQYYANRGAIVAMNPDTGAVYALASWPAYDPSVWVPPYTGQKAVEHQAKLANKDNHVASPLIDLTSSAFPAGSTFKPFTAISAWKSGIIGPGSTLPCTTSYTSPYDNSHHVFMNWGPVNATINLPTALEISCDTFFYRLGNAFYGDYLHNHSEPFQQSLRTLGFGRPPAGFDLLTSAGLVPTALWKKRYPCFQQGTPNLCKGYPSLSADQALIDQLWEPGDDINMSIGQGYLTVSPLQEAVGYSAIANGGRIVAPHVVKQVIDPATNQVVRRFEPRTVRNLHLSSELVSELTQGLYLATHSSQGTSSPVFASYNGNPFTVYGKTGTAEVPQDCPNCSDAWWSGWATNGRKKLVVVAMIQDGGHGGVAAAPAALRVFEDYFHSKITAVTGTDVSH
ncbi:MAG: penicillin-binding transpeptidase domain-containing protein [Gaiellales bacterium]